jgi:NADP-dependent 3-hydroxy acid dehydrogenase YdfG
MKTAFITGTSSGMGHATPADIFMG